MNATAVERILERFRRRPPRHAPPLSTPLISTPGTLRPLLRLALPVLSEHLLHLLVIFSDTVLAARYLGTEELAATNVIFYAVWFLENLFGLVAIGSTALVARFVLAGLYPIPRRRRKPTLRHPAGRWRGGPVERRS